MKQFWIPARIAIAVSFLLVVVETPATNAQTYTVLYNLTANSADPWGPQFLGTFAQARDGNMYGTSQNGGTLNHGAIFKLTPTGVLTVIHSFDLTNGGVPHGGLTLGTDGFLYGTTCNGGANNGGTFFQISTTGTYRVVHNFNLANNEGYCPEATPIQGNDGNFYGTTTAAPNPGHGTIYKMTSAGGLTTLHTFNDADGETPLALVLGIDGSLYGTSRYGGSSNIGAAFKITPAGVFKLLHSFNGTDGNDPIGPIIQANDGNFYGSTATGTSLYKMTPAGVLSTLTALNTQIGRGAYAGLIQANDGKFYGATTIYGTNGTGTIFQVTSAGVSAPMHNFAITTGYEDQVSVFQHTGGNFFGDTGAGGVSSKPSGVFFELNTGLSPFTRMLPSLSSAKVGKVVQFLGQGFTGTTAVRFNGVAATFTVVSDTFLTAVVPSGAQTGSVTITTPARTLTSDKTFRVTPQITSISPSSGAVATVVTITGVSLSQTTKVTFGGVSATTFTVNSDTKVTATVPAGAKTGKIIATTRGGTASSAANFTVTP